MDGRGLASLPADLVASVLLRLSPVDICSLAACCSDLLLLASDEQRVWKQLCEQSYSLKTNVACWLQSSGCRPCLYRWGQGNCCLLLHVMSSLCAAVLAAIGVNLCFLLA
jgi:hypothetical protein